MDPVLFKRVSKDPAWPVPSRGSEFSAGLDLMAHIDEPIKIAPGEIRLIPTGWAMAIPPGYEGQGRPRSGVATKKGLTLINSPGTVDSDYRGEVMIPLINHSAIYQTITRGDRLAQLVITKVEFPETVICDNLPETSRGEGGFGSTGQ
jgi:dUTP pyrophosphatase